MKFNWKNILKSQRTFQSLGVGEIDLESAVDETNCKEELLRLTKRLESVLKKIENSSQLSQDEILEMTSGRDGSYTTYNLVQVKGNEDIIVQVGSKFNDFSQFTEEEACFILDTWNDVEKGDVSSRNYHVREGTIQNFRNAKYIRTAVSKDWGSLKQGHIYFNFMVKDQDDKTLARLIFETHDLDKVLEDDEPFMKLVKELEGLM